MRRERVKIPGGGSFPFYERPSGRASLFIPDSINGGENWRSSCIRDG